MKYKICFFFFACNMLLGSIPPVIPAEQDISLEEIELKKAIPYEEWKTASYKDVAQEVVSVIIKFHKISDGTKDQLVRDISTGMEACENHEELPVAQKRPRKTAVLGEFVTMPHLALARLVDLCNNKVYPLPYIFASSSPGALQKRLKAFSLELPESIFRCVPLKKIKEGCNLMYAHSERAIFEMLLQDKKVLLGDNGHKYILQIKNSLPMCDNCQKLWLNKSYQNASKKYAGQFEKNNAGAKIENSPVNVWQMSPYLKRMEAFASTEHSLRHNVIIENTIRK